MSEKPKFWACNHAPPVEPIRSDRIPVDANVWKVEWGKRCPVCGRSYAELNQLTRCSK